MLFAGSRRRHRDKNEVASPELVRSIGTMNVYENADPDEVVGRLRNMSYGATHSRVTKLRSEQEAAPIHA